MAFCQCDVGSLQRGWLEWVMRGENGLNCFHKVSWNPLHSFCHMTHVHFTQSHGPRPPSLPLHCPLSPPSVCLSSIRTSASLGCCEREHEVCSKWHSTHTSFAVCSMYTVCKITLEVPGCPGSFAKVCATEHIVCYNVFHNPMNWTSIFRPKKYNAQVCECNWFLYAHSTSFVTHCMCQALNL